VGIPYSGVGFAYIEASAQRIPSLRKTIISSTKHSPIRFEKDRLFNLSAIAPVVRVIALMRDRDHTLVASFSIQTTYGQLFVELECFSPVFSRV
jgi:hypothetical protein